ncbi:MAG TPA: nuclear transport factor 2 family protein [Candidatus Angelobacter sp.]|nr:nuclear transport factor 2 family protein [Candidatus Angelobacter sp.]
MNRPQIRTLGRSLGVVLTFFLSQQLFAQQPAPSSTPIPGPPAQAGQPAAHSPLEKLLEGKVKAEWEAFKNKDKKAYSDLLADDYMGVEDDNQGQRVKYQAANEIDRSVIASYHLFALKVLPLGPNAALVTYEITMMFPPKAVVRFKRVLVSEIWIKRDGQWKERYYQETHVK